MSGPVVITGCHRSGTSMVASVLEAVGVWLGDDLLEAQPDNPKGFFESGRMVAASDALLAIGGGSWKDPPMVDVGARGKGIALDAATPTFTHFHSQSLDLWDAYGWKDPRACFTLPVWKSLFPKLRVVYVKRDPRHVAASLVARGDFRSSKDALTLVNRYQHAAEAAEPDVTTEYESWFTAPFEELGRVCDGLNLRPSFKAARNAVGRVDGTLRHHV